MRLCYGLLVAFLVACGSDATSYSGNSSPPPPGASVVNVSLTDNNGTAPYAFSPTALTIKVGTVVKWTNNGNAPHTSTSDATPQPTWDSGTLNPAGSSMCDPYDPYCTPGNTPAGTYQYEFNTVGTYQYHCAVHAAQGMTGTITVTP